MCLRERECSYSLLTRQGIKNSELRLFRNARRPNWPPVGILEPSPPNAMTDLPSAKHSVSFSIQKFPFRRPPDERSTWESLQRMRAAAEGPTAPAAVCLCSPQQETTPFEFLSDPLWHSRHQLMHLGPSAGYYPNQFTSPKSIFSAVNLLRRSSRTETSGENKQRAWPLKIDKTSLKCI